jgi:hypothetical protein
MKNLNSLAVAVAIACGASGVQAATISLSPANASALSGDQVSFDFIVNLGAEATSGGAVDFQWNPSVLTLVDFAYDPAFGIPPRDPVNDVEDRNRDFPPDTTDELGYVAIGFGNIATSISIPNDTKIGTLIFDVIGTDGMETDITLRDSLKWAGFFNGATFEPISVEYTGATFTVAPAAPVPLPAAGWLLLSGLAGLVGMARRKSA